MKRRDILLAPFAVAILGAAPRIAWAQAPAVVPLRKIGYIGFGPSPLSAAALMDSFRVGMRELGWVDHRNFVFEYRFEDGDQTRLPDLARQLVREKVDAIFAPGETVALAAKQATAVIPIVMVAAGDPVVAGLVASLARPGANVTGITLLAPGMEARRLQLLREALPKVIRVAVLWNAANAAHANGLRELEAAARTLGITLQSRPLGGAGQTRANAFALMRKEKAQALTVLGDAVMYSQRREIAALAAGQRLPVMWDAAEYLETGGLMSYGADLPDAYRRLARHADQILKGAKPADLPFEQPTKYQLTINQKNAKALRVVLPKEFLARADKVVG